MMPRMTRLLILVVLRLPTFGSNFATLVIKHRIVWQDLYTADPPVPAPIFACTSRGGGRPTSGGVKPVFVVISRGRWFTLVGLSPRCQPGQGLAGRGPGRVRSTGVICQNDRAVRTHRGDTHGGDRGPVRRV